MDLLGTVVSLLQNNSALLT